jgi:GPH family glycoside/pentoside/hexuronide:cation symporter
MYQETSERASGSSTRQLIGFVIGTGLAVALTPTIYGKLGWGALAVLWGTLAAIMYFVSLIGIQENPAFAARQEMTSWREQMRIVFNNRTFLIVLGINFMMRFILAGLLAVLPFYAEYVLGIDEEELTPLTSALFVTSGISVLFWQRIVRRFGTRSSMIVSMGIAAVFSLPLLLTTEMLATGIVLALLGLAIGGTILGPDMLFAELVDEDFVQTGQRREGMFRGIIGFVYRLPPAVAGLILGEGLALAGFDDALKASEQPDAVITMIRLFLAALPLIGLILGIVLLLIYPLHGAYLQDVQRRAAALREKLIPPPASVE